MAEGFGIAPAQLTIEIVERAHGWDGVTFECALRTLRGLGARRFKNISEPVRIYAAALLTDFLEAETPEMATADGAPAPMREHPALAFGHAGAA